MIQQTSRKLPADVMMDVCWTFAGSCKHPINFPDYNGCHHCTKYKTRQVSNKSLVSIKRRGLSNV